VKNMGHDKKNSRIHERIGLLMVRGQYRSALELLDKVIEDPLPLFQGESWVIEERRLAWLYRIDLLRERERVTEALAWACLEVEMNPDNVAAVALKERLKRESGLSVKSRKNPAVKSNEAPDSEGPWTGVAGMRDLKAMLERDVILPLQEPDIYELYRINLPNGILLYGPPGCGKTFIARKLAEVAGFSFIEVKPGDLASIYVHGTQGKIAEIFEEARQQVPCMIFFDEIDAMAPCRENDTVGHHYASEVNEFLVRLNECGSRRILVVGATNLPSRLDPAVLRPGRMDKKFFVAPPDYEARHELLQLYMRDRPQDALNWHTCAIELEHYTCAEIEFLVNEAARMALGEKRNITTDDILHAAGCNPQAHTAEAIEGMRSF
jgi:SpoVK/Ycf46/Vps4 family AAA+-type ATPase